MSDDEEVMSSEEESDVEDSNAEESENEEPQTPTRREMPQKSGPSEAEIAMQKRQNKYKDAYNDLDEETQKILEQSRLERLKEEEEIRLLKEKREQRKKEREEEEKRLAQKRQEEERQRKSEEEARRAKKDEEEAARRAKRAEKMAEFEKWKNPQKPNFVISKRAPGEGGDEEETDETKEKVSREQLEAEKKAILAQRIPKLDISGADAQKLTQKAGELHTLIHRLYSETYDLERRYKIQQYDMMELAERARQMNQVGKKKRNKDMVAEPVDKMQQKFAGCPSKIEMYSRFERQKDKRSYDERQKLYKGATYLFPAERIKPQKKLIWSEDGQPTYVEMNGGEAVLVDGEQQEQPVEG